jgi:hypothetical protein
LLCLPFDILRYVPEESARHYRFARAPLGRPLSDGVLEVGITDPDNLEARDALTFISAKVGMPYKLFLITETDFEKLLSSTKDSRARWARRSTSLRPRYQSRATQRARPKKAKSAPSRT